MTVITRWLFLLICILASLEWHSIAGQAPAPAPTVLPQGRIREGRALGRFLNETLQSNNFTFSAPCTWNEALVKCDDNYNVIAVNFSGFQLTGPIPAGTIANLTALESLDLSNNTLNGTLPDDFELLSKLTSLNLSRNKISGRIPLFIQNLSALHELDFSSNHLNGTLSGFQNLANLSVLRLYDNQLVGSLTDTNFPESLTLLDIGINNLSGPVPSTLFAFGLKTLRLGRNQLSEEINANDTRELQVLDLHDNRLSGGIPNLNNGLVELDLHGNQLNGTLPTTIPTNLQVLDLHDNKLRGNLSDFIDSLGIGSLLKTLDLSSNQFGLQSFPKNLGKLNLSSLGFANNQFTSHVFPDLPTANIQRLNLSSTNLTGDIPDSIGNPSKTLAVLDLSRNDLTGSIPASMGNLRNLEILNLSSNLLSGPIPANFANLTFLSSFDVSFNNLSGNRPDSTQFSTFPNTSFQGNPFLCDGNCSKSGVPSTGSRKSKKPRTGAIIGSVVVGVVLFWSAGIALFFWCRVSRAVEPLAKDETRHVSGPMLLEKDAETWARGIKDPSAITVMMFEKPLLNLTFADLLKATANFDKEMQLADGGYGPVYKGVLIDGSELAIKILVEVGFRDEKEATARIEELARVVRHPNLAALAGYCLVGEDSVLIYEYMVNGDLQRWLHELPGTNRNPDGWSNDNLEYPDGEISGDYLSWPTRYKIALGTARALAFLHHGCSPHVIHRDVKSSNILLDETFEPHLVDSGLAGVAKLNGTPVIGGTIGYIPPEYGQTWQATTRGDVYSFGVVLLELVTGRKPTGHYFHDSYGGNLVGWVRSIIKEEKLGQKALDRKLVSRGFVTEMLECLRIGYLCTADSPAKRPTMQQVVGLLKDSQSTVMS